MQRAPHIKLESLRPSHAKKNSHRAGVLAVSCREQLYRAGVPAAGWTLRCRLLQRAPHIELESLLPCLAKSTSHRAGVSAAVSWKDQLSSSWSPCCRSLQRATHIELKFPLPSLAKSNSHLAGVHATTLDSSAGGLTNEEDADEDEDERWTLHLAEN